MGCDGAEVASAAPSSGDNVGSLTESDGAGPDGAGVGLGGLFCGDLMVVGFGRSLMALFCKTGADGRCWTSMASGSARCEMWT